MRNMTPEWRLLCVLWILSSAGVAGIATAMAYKQPQTTTIQKTTPTHNINRLLKTDRYKPAAVMPQPKAEPVQIKSRKYWYA